MTPVENDIRCLKYEVKLLKKRPVFDNIVPATVEERSVEKPVDHSDDLESMKHGMNEPVEVLCCLKREIKQLKSAPVQKLFDQTAPVDLTSIESDLRCLKYGVRRLKQSEQPEIIEPFVSSSNEEALRYMKHEIKQLKETQPNTNKLDRTLRYIKYEIKLLKKRPIYEENSIPVTIEEHSNDTPINHIDDLDTVNNNVYELEEILRCMKHKI